MSEMSVVEGVIGKVTKRKDGTDSGLVIKGREGYLDYTKSEYRQQPWDDHREGDYVKLAVADGKWIQRIKVTAVGASNGASPSGGSPDSYTSLHRLEALKLAQAAAIADTELRPLAQFGAAVVALADVYARFVGGNFEQRIPEPPEEWE